MNKALKITLIMLPILIGGGVIYAQVKKGQGKKQKDDLLNQLQKLINQGNSSNASSSQQQAAQAAANQVQAIKNTGNSGCGYPLKKGSKNSCVTQLQWALINSYGSAILPRYGADGDWGSETESAMLQLAGKNVISSSADLNDTIMQILNKGVPVEIADNPYTGNIPWFGV